MQSISLFALSYDAHQLTNHIVLIVISIFGYCVVGDSSNCIIIGIARTTQS